MAKVKKHDVFIDMTAMSDVTVLLLTFFMLTATFLPKEPIPNVDAPASAKEIKVPESNVINILVDKKGGLYVNIDRPDIKMEALEKMLNTYDIPPFTDAQKKAFIDQPYIGTPISILGQTMTLSTINQDMTMREVGGIPNDSVDSQFTRWVSYAMEAGKNKLEVTLKADKETSYPHIDDVMKSLAKIKVFKYSLITVLRDAPEGF